MKNGKIVQVMGPVVDVEFPDNDLPNIKDALEVDNHGKKCIMEAAQHIGNNTVRCIMLAASEGLSRVEQGLIEEVKALKDQGYTKDLISMQGLGYKEILDYLDGVTSLDEALYILKRDTRHFAKRQITWFKREKEVTWVDKSEFTSEDNIMDFMLEQLRSKGIIS